MRAVDHLGAGICRARRLREERRPPKTPSSGSGPASQGHPSGPLCGPDTAPNVLLPVPRRSCDAPLGPGTRATLRNGLQIPIERTSTGPLQTWPSPSFSSRMFALRGTLKPQMASQSVSDCLGSCLGDPPALLKARSLPGTPTLQEDAVSYNNGHTKGEDLPSRACQMPPTS